METDVYIKQQLKEVAIGLGIDVNSLGIDTLNADVFRFYIGERSTYLLILFQLLEDKERQIQNSSSQEHKYIIDCSEIQLLKSEGCCTDDDNQSDYSESEMEYIHGSTRVVTDITGEDEIIDLTPEI